MTIAVLGAGSWGMALAQCLADGADPVVLWARDGHIVESLRACRRNPRYLRDIELDRRVGVTAELGAAVSGAEIVIVAVPAAAMRTMAAAVRPHLEPQAVVVSAAKGFDEATSSTMTGVLRAVLGESRRPLIAALSGPNIAIEIARGRPAATVVAGGSAEAVGRVREVCNGRVLRVYSNDDLIGVEFGGALKNVIAVAAGACDGIPIGDNGKAAVITRGVAEMARLGVAAGAQPLTFAGLTGLGDCLVTCMSPHSRNRRLGEVLARGLPLAAAMAEIGTTAEGVQTCRVARTLAQHHGLDIPLMAAVHAVLFEGVAVADAVADLMSRDATDELRGLGLDPVHSPLTAGE